MLVIAFLWCLWSLFIIARAAPGSIANFKSVETLIGEAKNFLRQSSKIKDVAEKWSEVLKSVEKVSKAARSTQDAVVSLGDKLSNISSRIETNKLETLFDGHVSQNDLRALRDPEMCVQVTKDILSLSEELDKASLVVSSVAKVLLDAKKLTERVSEFAGAFGEIGAPELQELVNLAMDLHAQLKAEPEKLKKIDKVLGPLMDYKSMSRAERIKHLVKNLDTINDNLQHLGESWKKAKELYSNSAHPVIANMIGTVSELKAYAETFDLPTELTDTIEALPGDGHLETIDAAYCTGRARRLFNRKSTPDTSTMTCPKTLLGFKLCSCRFKGTCFVTRADRPAPQEKKRCFKFVNEEQSRSSRRFKNPIGWNRWKKHRKQDGDISASESTTTTGVPDQGAGISLGYVLKVFILMLLLGGLIVAGGVLVWIRISSLSGPDFGLQGTESRSLALEMGAALKNWISRQDETLTATRG